MKERTEGARRRRRERTRILGNQAERNLKPVAKPVSFILQIFDIRFSSDEVAISGFGKVTCV